MSPFSLHQWRALLFVSVTLLAVTGWKFVNPPSYGAPTPREISVATVKGAPARQEGAGEEETGKGSGTAGAAEPAAADDGDGAAPMTDGEGRININSADVDVLQTLPGIGPVLAGRIVDYREGWGPFHHPEDLMEVSGIGPRIFERLRDLIYVEAP